MQLTPGSETSAPCEEIIALTSMLIWSKECLREMINSTCLKKMTQMPSSYLTPDDLIYIIRLHLIDNRPVMDKVLGSCISFNSMSPHTEKPLYPNFGTFYLT